jgi:hypothetical protein
MRRTQQHRSTPLQAIVLLLVLGLAVTPIHAQSPQGESRRADDKLFQTISALDTALFASANDTRCDMEEFRSYFAGDVEFYHDQTGLSEGIQTVAGQVEQNLCGKVRRELVAGSLKVFPMHGYGALETGVHRFYQPKVSKEPTGEAQFIHLWRNENGTWKITRVISYDHHALQD